MRNIFVPYGALHRRPLAKPLTYIYKAAQIIVVRERKTKFHFLGMGSKQRWDHHLPKKMVRFLLITRSNREAAEGQSGQTLCKYDSSFSWLMLVCSRFALSLSTYWYFLIRLKVKTALVPWVPVKLENVVNEPSKVHFWTQSSQSKPSRVIFRVLHSVLRFINRQSHSIF